MWSLFKQDKIIAGLYAGFDYPVGLLSAYLVTKTDFIVLLKEGSLIHFIPEDAEAFHNWLQLHKVRDINNITPRAIG